MYPSVDWCQVPAGAEERWQVPAFPREIAIRPLALNLAVVPPKLAAGVEPFVGSQNFGLPPKHLEVTRPRSGAERHDHSEGA